MNIWSYIFFALNLYPVKRRHFSVFKKNIGILKGNVLDVGCGKAPFKLPESVTGYVGVDISPAKTNKMVVAGDAMNLPFKHSTFNTVICTEVWEHLTDPFLCAKEISRVLRPDGMVYITAPMTWQLHYEPNDYFRFTCYGLTRICKTAGLKVEKTFPIGKGVFSTCYSRLADVMVCLGYRAFKPVEIVFGNKVRVFFASFVMCLPVIMLDCLAESLDRLIPSKDMIAWGIIAKKSRQNKGLKHTGEYEK